MRAHDLLYTALKSILMKQIEDPSIIKNASGFFIFIFIQITPYKASGATVV